MAQVYPDRTITPASITLTAQGTGTVDSADIDGGRGMGVMVFINTTAISGTGATLVLTIQGKDDNSGTYYTMLASANITATGFVAMRVFPGAPVTANVSANDILPPTFRVHAAVTGTTPSVTATISVAVVE